MNKTQKIRILIAIVSISLLQGLQYAVSPVLDQIHAHFPGVDISMVQMLVTMPALMGMLIALLSGWLVLKVSKRKLLLFGSLVAGVTGFLPLLADNFTLLFCSRLAYGIGLGLAAALNTAVVAEFFEGDERVFAMGIQAASVGAGILLSTTLGGLLGSYRFEYAYFVHGIGFVSLILLALTLPETKVAARTDGQKIGVNKQVLKLCVLMALEMLFLASFTTNISMHIGGTFMDGSAMAGLLIGVFSGAQILMGLVLNKVTRLTGSYTLPVAMLSFSVGALLLVLFPGNLVMLLLGAVFAGFSQGMFVPTAMCDASGAVPPVATAMASACLTCAMCAGQLLSPLTLNMLSRITFGGVQTGHVFLIAAICLALVALSAIILRTRHTVTERA